MSAAERLAQAVAAAGSTLAFGVPGGGHNLDVVGALTDAGVPFVLAHSETAAAIMASTHGSLTGAANVCVVTRGPGAASAANGAASATLDRHPLLLVTDTVPATSRTRYAHQRIDQVAMLAPLTKASVVLGNETSTDDLAGLIDLAKAAPAGCVHLDYDTSVAGHRGAVRNDSGGSGDPEKVSEVIAAADRPVVIVGLGASDAIDQVRRAVRAFGAPVMTTYQGTGVVDSEGPNSAGLFTNGASEQELLEQADAIVLIGVDLVEPIRAPWTYDAPVVSISATPTTDDYLPIRAEAIGDVGALAEQLLGVTHEWPAEAGSAHRERVRGALVDAGPGRDAFGPVELVRACIDAAPPDPTVTVDAGAHFLAIMPFWPVDGARRLLISNGLATMGYAVPAAIGASLARPGEPVVALTGDGGLGMCLAELETIVRRELPITVVVFNDSALSLIKIKQGDDHGGEPVVRYGHSDFAAIAAGMGMRSTVATTASDVARGFADADGGPFLIDARIDPSAYPELIRITRG